MNANKTNPRPMTAAVLLLCAAAAVSVFTAAPSFGKSQHRVIRHYHSGYGYRDYSGYMTPGSGHFDPEFQRNRQNFGFSGRDPSYPGGEDPSLHPPGIGAH